MSLGALLACGAVGACSPEPLPAKGSGAPSATTTVTTPSVTPTATTPAAAPTDSSPPPGTSPTLPASPTEASLAVVEEFFAAYTRGMQTGDSGPMRAVTENDCNTCAELATTIDDLGRRGVTGTGGEVSLRRIIERISANPEYVTWEISFVVDPIRHKLVDGSTQDFTKEESTVYIETGPTDAGWKIRVIGTDVVYEDEN